MRGLSDWFLRCCLHALLERIFGHTCNHLKLQTGDLEVRVLHDVYPGCVLPQTAAACLWAGSVADSPARAYDPGCPRPLLPAMAHVQVRTASV